MSGNIFFFTHKKTITYIDSICKYEERLHRRKHKRKSIFNYKQHIKRQVDQKEVVESNKIRLLESV